MYSNSDSDNEDTFYKLTKKFFSDIPLKDRVADSGSDLEYDDRKATVCLQNVPKELNETGLKKICYSFGYVQSINKMNNPPYHWFIQFKSEAEAAKAINGINGGNVIGDKKIHAVQARRRRKKRRGAEENVQRLLQGLPESRSETDYLRHSAGDFSIEQRTLKWPFTLPTKFAEGLLLEPITEIYYRKQVALSRADVTKQFLFSSYKQTHFNCENNFRQIIDGRGVFKIDDELPGKASNDSILKGTYDAVKNQYSWSAKKNLSCKITYCDNCNDLADKHCQACKAPYCSVQCIQEDLNHSERCGENLQKICEIRSTSNSNEPKPIPTQPEPIAHRCAVLITSVIDHRTVFVRPMGPKENEYYIQLINSVALESRIAGSLLETPSAGDWVLAPWQQIYGRAIVLKVNSTDDILCGLIDFGNVVSCRLSELKEISDDLKRGRWLTKKVELINVPPCCINAKELELLTQLMLKNEKVYLFHDADIDEDDDESEEFELFTKYSKSINAEIRTIYDKSKRLTIQEADCVYYVCHFEKQEIDGANIPVIVTENKSLAMGEIAVIRACDVETFMLNERLINAYGRATFNYFESDVYTPRENELCLVRHGSNVSVNYYRGQCLEVGQDGHPTIFFVDYGCMRPIEINDIRPMADTLMFPLLTRTVGIEGLTAPESVNIEMVHKKTKLLQSILPIGIEMNLLNAEKRNNHDDDIVVKLSENLMKRLKAHWYELSNEPSNATVDVASTDGNADLSSEV